MREAWGAQKRGDDRRPNLQMTVIKAILSLGRMAFVSQEIAVARLFKMLNDQYPYLPTMRTYERS